MELAQGQRVRIEGATGDRERFNGRYGKLVLEKCHPAFAFVRLDGGGNTQSGYRVFLVDEVKGLQVREEEEIRMPDANESMDKDVPYDQPVDSDVPREVTAAEQLSHALAELEHVDEQMTQLARRREYACEAVEKMSRLLEGAIERARQTAHKSPPFWVEKEPEQEMSAEEASAMKAALEKSGG